MLIGQITPAASIVKQDNPMDAPVTITADYFTAIARPYRAGAASTNFEVQFGTVTKDDKGVATSFQQQGRGQVTLTSADLSNWGTDDSVLLSAIAVALKATASNFVTIEGDNF
jgi:hypothetical protein